MRRAGSTGSQSESSVGEISCACGRALVWRLVAYNVQALNPKRPVDFVLSRLDASVAGLQGTRLPPRVEPATYPARQQTTWTQRVGAYHVVHWTRPIGSSSGDPRGVSIAWLHRPVPRRFAHWESPPESLAGRVGFVRLKRLG